MADRVPKITQEERPDFDAGTFSDRLQEGRTVPAPRAPAAVFDKTKPSSIVGMAKYVRGLLTDRVNALSEFTARHELSIMAARAAINQHEDRLDTLEAARLPFGSRSG